MTIKVGLLFRGLVDRFHYHLVVKYFNARWIRTMSKPLSSFVFTPDEEKVRLTLPKRSSKYSSVMGIIL